MKIGNKIKKIRELKSFSQENMAEELKMSVAGYSRIERNEVDVNIERLQQISEIFKMRPEDVLTFDEKQVFHIHDNHLTNSQIGSHINTLNQYFPEDFKKLQEDYVRILEENNNLLRAEIERLKTEK